MTKAVNYECFGDRVGRNVLEDRWLVFPFNDAPWRQSSSLSASTDIALLNVAGNGGSGC